MELYVFEKDLNLNGVIDNFNSLRWVRKFYETGNFQLTVPATDINCNLLTLDRIVYKKNSIEAGYIVNRTIDKNVLGQEVLVVQGFFLTGYLSQRINWGTITHNGTVEDLMRKLVNANCINPSDKNRILPYWELGDVNNFSEKINFQDSYGNIETLLTNLSLNNHIGYRAKFDYKNKKIIFEIYKGVDKSYNQGSLTAPVIFSRDFENVLTQSYFEDNQSYKNVALIGGEGEGKDRKLISIGSSIGIDRKELFVDARDLQREVDTGLIPENEYEEILINRGNEKLSNYKNIVTFESSINTLSNNTYKDDWDLGDIVTIIDKKWGIKVNSRITQVEETYDISGVQIIPTFGYNVPTLIDKIKRKMG